MEYRLHIGAHKTATTHLQDSLRGLIPELRAKGVSFVPRAQASREIESLFKARYRVMPELYRRYRWMRFVQEHSKGCERMILSHEGIMGHSADLLAPKIYPDLERRLQRVLALVNSRNVTLYLSIRNYASLLPSAYVQALKKGEIAPGFERYVRQWMTAPPSWPSLVERLRKFQCPIVIWDFEDYVKNPRVYLSLLTGAALSSESILQTAPERTRSPELQAIIQMEQSLRNSNTFDDYGPKTETEMVYRFLNEQEKEMFTAIYQNDLSNMSLVSIK